MDQSKEDHLVLRLASKISSFVFGSFRSYADVHLFTIVAFYLQSSNHPADVFVPWQLSLSCAPPGERLCFCVVFGDEIPFL